MFKNLLAKLFDTPEQKEKPAYVAQAPLIPNNPAKVIDIEMPKLTEKPSKYQVKKWNVKPGDVVKEGDILCDIESDKVAMEFENMMTKARIIWCCSEKTSMNPGEVICKLEEVQ